MKWVNELIIGVEIIEMGVVYVYVYLHLLFKGFICKLSMFTTVKPFHIVLGCSDHGMNG